MCADPLGPGLKGCWSAFPPLPPRWGSGQRLGRPGERPAGSRVRRHPLLSPLPPPPALSGRLAPCRAALLCLCISPPRGGGGGPLSRRGAVRGREGGLPRLPARARVPGARASPGRGGAGSREAPPAVLAPGRGSPAALFGVRPPASRAQPTRPFPSPCLLASDPRSLGNSHWATLAAVGAVGGWLLRSELNGSMGKPILPKGA